MQLTTKFPLVDLGSQWGMSLSATTIMNIQSVNVVNKDDQYFAVITLSNNSQCASQPLPDREVAEALRVATTNLINVYLTTGQVNIHQTNHNFENN